MADLPPDYREGIIENFAKSILSLGYLGRDLGIENKKLKAEVAYLKSEIERLRNNNEYIDKKLDEYIDGEAE
jgi:predicted RNase H-like nuclease (RuvC/YqgF family)